MVGTAGSGIAIGSRKRGAPLTREWLFDSVDTVPEAGCWVWRGRPNGSGYGMVCIGKKGSYKPTHRVAYELYNGEIPAGLIVMHKCDTPLCVNPDHLVLGTKLDNNRDRNIKWRSAGKLTPNQVLSIVSDMRAQAAVALDHRIDRSTVSNIKNGKHHAHLTGIHAEKQKWRRS